MFDELNKYKNHGHFFFSLGDNLKDASAEVPNLPGIYVIYRLARGRVELVYIGKSGTVEQNGDFKKQLLNSRLNNKQEGISRQQYFEQKIKEQNIDALDIYWYATFDEKHQDLPAYVEGLILQRFFDVHGRLPEWNKEM